MTSYNQKPLTSPSCDVTPKTFKRKNARIISNRSHRRLLVFQRLRTALALSVGELWPYMSEPKLLLAPAVKGWTPSTNSLANFTVSWLTGCVVSARMVSFDASGRTKPFSEQRPCSASELILTVNGAISRGCPVHVVFEHVNRYWTSEALEKWLWHSD